MEDCAQWTGLGCWCEVAGGIFDNADITKEGES